MYIYVSFNILETIIYIIWIFSDSWAVLLTIVKHEKHEKHVKSSDQHVMQKLLTQKGLLLI